MFPEGRCPGRHISEGQMSYNYLRHQGSSSVKRCCAARPEVLGDRLRSFYPPINEQAKLASTRKSSSPANCQLHWTFSSVDLRKLQLKGHFYFADVTIMATKMCNMAQQSQICGISRLCESLEHSKLERHSVKHTPAPQHTKIILSLRQST